MRSRRVPLIAVAAVAVSILLAVLARAAEPKFPALTGRVVDEAGILSQSTVDQLTQMLQGHEKATGQQLVVVTVSSLQGYTIEQFGYQLGRYWGIGQKGTNNGVLLIVAPNQHKVRIEVGYGMEGVLTDAQSSVIIQQVILPQFRRGDFNAGVLDGTRDILRIMSGEQVEAPPQAQEEHAEQGGLKWAIPLFLVLFEAGISWFALFGTRRHGRGRGRGATPWYAGSGGSSSWGSSGGGFSGGGGSFGGGGASGSW